MTREDIIRQIVDRDLHNQGLSAEVVLKEANGLYSAACEKFGTWDTALNYAGVSLRRVTVDDEYSRGRVLQRIRKLCYDGYDLSANHNARRDWRLYSAARQHFGTWRLGLQAAGINLENVRPPSKLRLNKQKIIEELRRRQEEGLGMKWCQVCLDNRALARAAKNTFHSWRRALAAAGLAPAAYLNQGGPRWDKRRVIEAIRSRQRDGKCLTNAATVEDDGALVSAARRYFGNWTEALQAAGVRPDERQPEPPAT